MIFFILAKFIFYNFLIFLALLLFVKLLQLRLRLSHFKKYGKSLKVITFIHPNCYDFGGGEKVLWMIINALTKMEKELFYYKINILTAPKSTKEPKGNTLNEALMQKLKERFSIVFSNHSNAIKEIEMIEFKTAKYLSPFPYFTMLLQIIFQMLFAFEISTRVSSDLMIDTTGLPFTYSILGFFGKYNLSAYVHYPFISDDMINDIRTGREGVHSRGFFAKYKIYKQIKLIYYSVILKFYKFNGNFLSFIFTNSTWTHDHMKAIIPNVKNEILYPPCSIGFYRNEFENIPRKENVIVSFAQFRPEKNQKMQIDILRKVRNMLPTYNVKLWLLGGVRNDDDKALYNGLKNYVNILDLNEVVEFHSNLPSSDIKKKFEVAKIGIHTMKDEHFGISIIEMMSAGLITIAHNSAGPQKDIIGRSKNPVGLLCEDEDSYVKQIVYALKNYNTFYPIVQENCNEWVDKFSDENFKLYFISSCFDQKLLD